VRFAAAACEEEEVGGGRMDEKTFRFLLNADGCTTEKMSEGLRAFISDTDTLEAVIRAHPSW
jgi:transaldolase